MIYEYADFMAKYALLDDRMKLLLKLFSLAVEDTTVNDLNSTSIYRSTSLKPLTMRVKDCNELVAMGLLEGLQYSKFRFPLYFQAHFFPLAYNEYPVLAANIHNYYITHSSGYYSNASLLIKLRKAMLFALGYEGVKIQEFITQYEQGRIDSRIAEILFTNPVFHPLVKSCDRLLPATLYEKYIERHIFNGMEIGNLNSWFVPLFDLMALMGLDNGKVILKSNLNDQLMMLSAKEPEDQGARNPEEWQIRYYPPLIELYHCSDFSNIGLADQFAKESFVLQSRRFDHLNPMIQYAFCLLLIANKDLSAKLQPKVVKFFGAKTADPTFINLINLAFGEFKQVELSLNRETNRNRPDYNWVEVLSLLAATYILNKKLPAFLEQQASASLKSLKKNGYLVPAYEMAFILMTETKNKAYEEIFEELKARLGFLPLIMKFRKKQDYENKLEAIISIVQNSNAAVGNIQSSRIIYFVDGSNGHIQPVLQTRKGAGWTSGRDCSLPKFRKGEYPGMTDQDYLFASCIREYRSYYGNYSQIEINAAWKALVGHPLLFNIKLKYLPVELVLHKPALILRHIDDTYHLEFDRLPKNAELPVEVESDSRIVYIETSVIIEKIREQMAGGKLRVPKKGKDLVVKALESVSKVINVFSDIDTGPVNDKITEKPADSILRVLLAPYGNGLRAQLAAKPFGSDPPYVSPGEGSKVLYTQINGEKTKVSRDLDAEADNLLILEDSLYNEGLITIEKLFLDFPNPMDALVLLDILQRNQDICKVEWPEGVKFKISGFADFSNLSLKIKKSGNWFDIEGEIKVSDTLIIGMKQLIEMQPIKGQRFIEIADGEFIRLSADLQRKLDELRSQVISDKKGLHISGLSLPYFFSWSSDFGSFSTDKAAKEIKKKYDSAQEAVVEIPANLEAELRPYQVDGYNWIVRLAEWGAGACLADDMGLGKTVQSIAFLLIKAHEGPSLVVCPASVLPNWISEVNRFAPALNISFLNSGKRNETIEKLKEFDLLITTYGLIQSEDELFASIEWNVAVLDEAHVIKNHTTKTWTAAMGLKAKNRLALSGTPVQNNLDELWSIFNFINPGLLGTFKSFSEKFTHPVADRADSPQKNLLRKIIGPFLMRRLKNQVLDELPPKTEILLPVLLSEGEMALYEALRQQAIRNINSESKKGAAHIQALAELTRLRLACCNPRLVKNAPELGSSKLTAFLMLVEELVQNRHRALVFSQFTSHLALVREALEAKGVNYLYLDGSTAIKQRGELVKTFQQGSTPLFLISLKAGGLGLNLTGADFVIHLDPWWNPAVEDQATDRTHRIGQSRPVTVYRLVAANTIEEKIIRLHHTKRELAESILLGADAPQKPDVNEMLKLIQEG